VTEEEQIAVDKLIKYAAKLAKNIRADHNVEYNFPKNEEERKALEWYAEAKEGGRLMPARISSDQQMYLRNFSAINHLRSYDYDARDDRT